MYILTVILTLKTAPQSLLHDTLAHDYASPYQGWLLKVTSEDIIQTNI